MRKMKIQKMFTEFCLQISDNISNTQQKEIFDQEETIDFEIEYLSNKDMPDGEMIKHQEGIAGSKIVTYVRSYENDVEISLVSIGERILQEPQKEIVEVGTSKVLKDYDIHIGDSLYAIQDIGLKKTVNVNSDEWLTVSKFYDAKVIEIIDEEWFKVSYNNKNTGYIQKEFLTSETLTPGISEECRKAKILNKVNLNMALNEPSGLSLDDFKKVLSNQSNDTNNVFKENYKVFYDAEQKYGINGIFLASIAIHESGWGKSRIAIDKHNLFGFGAYDESPYESAVTFDSYSEGALTVAAWLSTNYLNPAGAVLKTGEIASRKIFQWLYCCWCKCKICFRPRLVC